MSGHYLVDIPTRPGKLQNVAHAGALIAATASILAALPAHAQTLEDGPTLPSLTSPVSGSAVVDQAVGTVIDAVKVG